MIHSVKGRAMKAHGVELDYVGFGGYPRLTCMTPGCDGATLIRQPYMTAEQFSDKLKEYDKAHPCKTVKKLGFRG